MKTPNKNLGRSHTEESKARISAANKGNVPWNKGRTHSEETRRKIAETTRRNAERRKAEKLAAKLAELGLTEEEYRAQELAKKQKPRNTTVTTNTREKISASLKVRPGLVSRCPLCQCQHREIATCLSIQTRS